MCYDILPQMYVIANLTRSTGRWTLYEDITVQRILFQSFEVWEGNDFPKIDIAVVKQINTKHVDAGRL